MSAASTHLVAGAQSSGLDFDPNVGRQWQLFFLPSSQHSEATLVESVAL